ncbi:hypothetical protein [Nonomuraea sp. NPDC049709]
MREHGFAGEIAVVATSYPEEGGYRGARLRHADPGRPPLHRAAS